MVQHSVTPLEPIKTPSPKNLYVNGKLILVFVFTLVDHVPQESLFEFRFELLDHSWGLHSRWHPIRHSRAPRKLNLDRRTSAADHLTRPAEGAVGQILKTSRADFNRARV